MRDEDLQSHICFRHDTDVTTADADLSVGMVKAEDGDVTFSMEHTDLKAGSGTADASAGSTPQPVRSSEPALCPPAPSYHGGQSGPRQVLGRRSRCRAGSLVTALSRQPCKHHPQSPAAALPSGLCCSPVPLRPVPRVTSWDQHSGAKPSPWL